MADPGAPPTPDQAAAIERFADSLYELLRTRARSLGAMDIEVEPSGWLVEAEVLFGTGPDMGIRVDAASGVARYCVLLDGEEQSWCDAELGSLEITDANDEPAAGAQALLVLGGMLDARRPLLRTET